MKKLEKKDLIKDEVYKHENGNLVKYQFDGDVNGKIKGSYIGNNVDRFYKEPDSNFTISSLKLATPEEKHWLEVCIAANSFISYEEAMKTFVQYYKIIESKIGANYNNNVIHEESILFNHYNGNNRIIKAIENGKHHVFSTIDVLYGEIGDQKVCFDMLALEPSTKEAYDAQFVVKEPEFMLPEKWYLELKSEFAQIICDYVIKNKPNYYNEWKPVNILRNKYISNDTNTGPVLSSNSIYGTEITFEQFKKYVLKEQLEEPKDKVLVSKANDNHNSRTLTIVKVQCSEGGVYQLGDKIKVFTHNSPNKGKVFTIKGFRWNNAKTKLCAITEVHSPNGIGLDKIELYSEPKQIVEDFKLPKTWWITIENEKQLEIAKQYFSQHLNSISKLSIENTVGFVKSTYLSQPLFLTTILPSTKQTNPQITFEQFEQYVLHNGFKVGDIINNGNWIIIDLQYIDGHSVAFYKYCHNNYSGPQCRILTKNIVR